MQTSSLENIFLTIYRSVAILISDVEGVSYNPHSILFTQGIGTYLYLSVVQDLAIREECGKGQF